MNVWPGKAGYVWFGGESSLAADVAVATLLPLVVTFRTTEPDFHVSGS